MLIMLASLSMLPIWKPSAVLNAFLLCIRTSGGSFTIASIGKSIDCSECGVVILLYIVFWQTLRNCPLLSSFCRMTPSSKSTSGFTASTIETGRSMFEFLPKLFFLGKTVSKNASKKVLDATDFFERDLSRKIFIDSITLFYIRDRTWLISLEIGWFWLCIDEESMR